MKLTPNGVASPSSGVAPSSARIAEPARRPTPFLVDAMPSDAERRHRANLKRPAPQPIVISFAAPRAPTVVARRVGPDGAIVAAAAQREGGLDASRLRGAAAAVVAQHAPVDHDAMVDAADRGVVTSQSTIMKTMLVQQLAMLISLMPVAAFIVMCHVRTEAEVLRLGYERVAHHVIERAKRPWKWSTIRDARNNWARWLLWLDRHEVEHDGAHFNAVDLGDFYEEVDSRARAKGPANKARAEARDAQPTRATSTAATAALASSSWLTASASARLVRRCRRGCWSG